MAKRLKSVPWLAGWFALSTAAHAGPPSPAYPSKTDPASVRAWIAADTSLDPAQITLIAEGAVFALLPSDTAPGSDGVLVRRLREEVYSPAVAAALGGRSSTATVFFDCAHSSYSLRDPQVYPGASLQGEAKSVTPSRWLSASVVYLYDLAASVCPTGRSAPPPQVAPVDPPVSAPSPPKADDIPAAPTTVTAPAFDAGPPAEAGATPRAPAGLENRNGVDSGGCLCRPCFRGTALERRQGQERREQPPDRARAGVDLAPPAHRVRTRASRSPPPNAHR